MGIDPLARTHGLKRKPRPFSARFLPVGLRRKSFACNALGSIFGLSSRGDYKDNDSTTKTQYRRTTAKPRQPALGAAGARIGDEPALIDMAHIGACLPSVLCNARVLFSR
jgi:hypothetical protein